jgi:hypothetical protein
LGKRIWNVTVSPATAPTSVKVNVVPTFPAVGSIASVAEGLAVVGGSVLVVVARVWLVREEPPPPQAANSTTPPMIHERRTPPSKSDASSPTGAHDRGSGDVDGPTLPLGAPADHLALRRVSRLTPRHRWPRQPGVQRGVHAGYS